MGEILNLIESVSGGFPSYFFIMKEYKDSNICENTATTCTIKVILLCFRHQRTELGTCQIEPLDVKRYFNP